MEYIESPLFSKLVSSYLEDEDENIPDSILKKIKEELSL